jgi:two-component system, LytTR family, response regulator
MNTLVLNTQNGQVHINPHDIIYIRSFSNYSQLVIKNRKKLLVAKVLKWFELYLSSTDFVRVHASHLVNIKCIQHIDLKIESKLYLYNGEAIKISRRRRKMLVA